MHAAAAPFVPERLIPDLLALPGSGTWWVAFSGGADSMALLHALVAVRHELPATIRALHVDHCLHPDSAEWADFCAEICSLWSIPLQIERIRVRADRGRGLEAEARRTRYAAAASLLEAGDVLLTAHHADDQAETVILNLMRGSGIDGLAGMPFTRSLGNGQLARPLLPYPGSSLRQYLSREGLEWIEDTSNRDLSYDRNFVRHELVPVLEKRWPGSWRNLSLSARYCREASDFVAASCRGLLDACLQHPRILDLACLRGQASDPERETTTKQVIRHWLREAHAPSLPRNRLQELLRQVNDAGRESHVNVQWEGWVLQYYRDCLWLQREEEIRPCPGLPWETSEALEIDRILGTLSLDDGGASLPWRLRIEPRRGGERIACLPEGRHRSIKQVLQEAKIPPWLRPSVPILWLDDRVVAVGTLALDQGFERALQKSGATLTWNPRDSVLKMAFRHKRDHRG